MSRAENNAAPSDEPVPSKPLNQGRRGSFSLFPRRHLTGSVSVPALQPTERAQRRGSMRRGSVSQILRGLAAPSEDQYRWEFASDSTEISSDGKSVTCTEDQGDDAYATCVASALPKTGVMEFSIRIIKCDQNASGLLVGIGEDTGSRNKAGRTWGIAAWNGRLLSFPAGRRRDASRTGEIRGGALMSGDLRGNALGKRIYVKVDMSQRRLHFRVNTAEYLLAIDGEGRPLTLPDMVRPFVRFSHLGDSVELGTFAHTEVKTTPPPLPSVAVPSPAPAPAPPPAMERWRTMQAAAAAETVERCTSCRQRRREEEVLRSEVASLREQVAGSIRDSNPRSALASPLCGVLCAFDYLGLRACVDPAMHLKLQTAEAARDVALERGRLLEQRYKRSELRWETSQTLEIEASLLREAVMSSHAPLQQANDFSIQSNSGATGRATRWVAPLLREGRRVTGRTFDHGF